MKYLTRVHLSQVLRAMRQAGGDALVLDDFVGDLFPIVSMWFEEGLVICELENGRQLTMHPAMYRRLPVMEDRENGTQSS